VVEFWEGAPVLPVSDLGAAMDHYRRLGFDVKEYVDDEGNGGYYGYANRGRVHLHLALAATVDPTASQVEVYLYVDDADALHAEWSTAGLTGRLSAPTDTPYGLREGAHVDPDGNALRYGSPLPLAVE
jgi:predicted enzyme related to lactoylglutathione lyase